MRNFLILALFAVRAFAACASGYISIVDPFTLPNGQSWTGSIVYTLAYNTTVAGATTVQAQQNLQVTNGINICLAPGLYTPVQYNQSGVRYVLTQSWGVPSTGGPYTIAQIQGTINLGGGAQGPAGPTGPAGATGPQGPTGAPGPGGGLIQVVQVSIPQSQVLTLNTSPVQIIPAPPAGSVNLLTGWAVQVTGTANYQTDDFLLLLQLHAATIQEISCLGGSTGNANYFQAQFAISNGGYQLEASQITGYPLMATTTDQNPTGTGGPIVITAWYVTLSGVAP